MRTLRIAALAAGITCLAGIAAAQDVEFMTWTYTEESGKPLIEGMIADFNSGTVEPQGYAWGEMVKNAFLRARTGSLPDVMQVQARLLPTVANIDGILDLNEVYGAEALAEMFSPELLAYGQVDGVQVALPWMAGTIGMVANTAVLEAAGVEGIPATVDEFTAALEAVRDNVPNSVPYPMATKNANSILLDYLIWVWTHGGDVIVNGQPQVDSPEAVAALTYMTKLVNERLAAPEIDRPDARRLFGQGAAAFYFDAPSAKQFAVQFSGDEDYAANVQPMATPVMEAGADPVAIQWGHVVALFGDDNADADSPGAAFLMHLVSDAQVLPYTAEKGTLPPTLSGQADADFQADAYRAAWAANAGSPRRNTVAALSNGAEVSTIIGEEVQAAILGQKSPEDAAADMQSRLEAAIADAS